MKKSSRSLMVAGLALALAVPAVSAWSDAPGRGGAFQMAQDEGAEHAPPAGGPGMMGMRHDMMGGPGGHESHMARMCDTAEAHHAAMLAYAEVRLKITDAQKPAWTKFTEAAKAAHANLTKLCETKDQPAPTTLPEKLARAERFTQAKLAHLQALRPALDELYKTLTPEQQKVANSLNFGGHGHGHHGM